MATATSSLQSPSQSDSLVGDETNWDALPPDTQPVVNLAPAPEEKDITGPPAEKVEAGICATCLEPIIREPGARGRMPKYHPDCRPLKTASVSATATKARAGRAEAEADQCIVAFQQLVTKTAVMLSVVDRYDAFCIMVALPNLCENLKGVLIRYESFRKEMLAMKTGGSIFGLILAVLMLSLPMAAHHGFLGRGKTAQLLMEMPFTMLKIAQRLKEGSESLTKMMEEQLRAAAAETRRQAAEAQRTQNGAA
jgi:hypothetical protein